MNTEQAAAVISGGASGLGRATAERLIAAGAQVTILDLSEDKGRETAETLGERAHFIRTDISNEREVNEAVAAAEAAMGRITLALNCAGIIGAGRVLGKEGPMAGSDFELTLRVNLLGSFLLTKAAAAQMQHNEPNNEGERGVVVATASVAAFEGQIGQAAYSASKGGIVSMTLPIARELARFGIRMMTIAPGIFLTPMMEGMRQDIQDSLAAQVPFPSRLGRPAEFADLVAYIYETPMLNGETIRLDGAIRMQPK